MLYKARHSSVFHAFSLIVRWVQVQTDNIKNLLSKVWAVADLERFQAMGLQVCRLPDLLYLPTGYSGMFRH
jgi:hypothetical protein